MGSRTNIKTTGECVLGLMMFIAKVIALATLRPVITSVMMIGAMTTGTTITAMTVIIAISSADCQQDFCPLAYNCRRHLK